MQKRTTYSYRIDKDGQFAFVVIPDFYIFIVYNYINADRHPKCDICDVYAHADLYGLGKGIFPKDKFPKLPAHPQCLCRIKPIVDGMIDMSKAKDNVDKGGKAYIDTLPKREQERLLGVHGKENVMGGKKEWMQKARGWGSEGFSLRIPYNGGSRGAVGAKLNDTNDPSGKKRSAAAEPMYEEMRRVYLKNPSYYANKWATDLGMHPSGVKRAIEHLLFNKHHLIKDGKAYYGRFEVDYDIAATLMNIKNGNIGEKEMRLFRHERLGSELMYRYNYKYNDAHDLANKKHNFEELVCGI